MPIDEFDGPPSWSLDANETGESTKIPVGSGGEVHSVGVLLTPTLWTSPPLPTGILYSPQFRSHQETKMVARRTQRSASTISRKNRGLWTVYSISCICFTELNLSLIIKLDFLPCLNILLWPRDMSRDHFVQRIGGEFSFYWSINERFRCKSLLSILPCLEWSSLVSLRRYNNSRFLEDTNN